MSISIHPEFQKALDLGHVIPALLPNGELFKIEGIQFYQASEDGVNMYQGRLMAFTDVIEKHDRLKLDEATIRAFFVAVSESATQTMLLMGKDPEQAVQHLSDIISLAAFGKQRLDLYDDVAELNIGSNTGRVYELGSVWYFACDEDPASYNPLKGKRNVDLFLRNADLYDFFLRLRLDQFAPLASLSAENTLRSMKAVQEADQEAILRFTQILLRLKMSGANHNSIHYLDSLTATLRAYNTCYAALWKSLMTTWPLSSENSVTT